MANANRWAISEDVYLSKGPRPSPYSAKWTFDPLGYTRWLYFMSRMESYFQYWWTYGDPALIGLDEELWWRALLFQFETDLNQRGLTNTYNYQLGGWLRVGPNPPHNKWTFEQEIYVTKPCKWQVDGRIYTDCGEFDPVVGPSGLDVWIPIEVVVENDQVFDLEEGWNTVRYELNIPNEHMPSVPFSPNRNDQDFGCDYGYGYIRFRAVDGVEGESVYLARTLAWPMLTTQSSQPLSTIGVAEWIRDERGMYVGCRLWVRTASAEVVTSQGVV